MDDSSSFKPKKIIKDKSDKKTIQKVLDPKTMKILEKLEAREKLKSLTGCISTGKEANIYTCMIQADLSTKFITSSTDEFIPAAIKIYQTSVMEFKNRGKYIQDELRFQSFSKNNPRKLVKLWAEKEVRNLKRLNKNNILSPKPIYLKNNILIMSLIGTQEKIAPKLKDAIIVNLDTTYSQCLTIIDDLYNKANLIHSDLSEYNLLYHNEKIYVIDVGQSVERNHPSAFSFLIMDINNINRFFLKKGVAIQNVNDIFEKITKTKVPSCLKDVDLTKDAFIPTRLDDIVNIEDLNYFFKQNTKLTERFESNTIEEESNESTNSNDSQGIVESKIEVKLSKEEKKKQMKENKKNVKEENRIKRTVKVSKKEKEKFKKIKKKRSK